jgi:hypothetical protein
MRAVAAEEPVTGAGRTTILRHGVAQHPRGNSVRAKGGGTMLIRYRRLKLLIAINRGRSIGSSRVARWAFFPSCAVSCLAK